MIMAGGRDVHRGEVFLGNMAGAGSRLWKNRPVLVVQNDIGNRYSPETIVVAIRSGPDTRHLPIRTPIPKGEGGLDQDSFVDAGQIVTLRKDALGRRLGRLSPDAMAGVDRALRISLGL